jgi:hypothetical protein
MIERVNAGEIPLVEIQETVIEIPEGKETTVELEDGSIEITIEEPEESSSILEAPFDSNLAEFLERDRLNSIGYDLVDLVKADEQSREDWLEGFRDGMKLLGFKPEDRTEPWAGACGIVSTMIPEAVVRFQSNAMTEVFPADGPDTTRRYVVFVLVDEPSQGSRLGGAVAAPVVGRVIDRIAGFLGVQRRIDPPAPVEATP